MILQKLQGFVKVLQSYSTLCTEKVSVLSSLVNCDMMQRITKMISVDFWPRLCRFCPRPLWDQL